MANRTMEELKAELIKVQAELKAAKTKKEDRLFRWRDKKGEVSNRVSFAGAGMGKYGACALWIKVSDLKDLADRMGDALDATASADWSSIPIEESKAGKKEE
jgi:hypothetical protein